MTEPKWLAATDPVPMLEFLRGKASDRKLRLFACACCRRVEHLLSQPGFIRAVETAEEFADGEVGADETRIASEYVLSYYHSESINDDRQSIADLAAYAASAVDYLDDFPSGVASHCISAAVQAAWKLARSRAEGLVVEPQSYPASLEDAKEFIRSIELMNDAVDAEATPFEAQEKLRQAILLGDIFGNPFRPVPFDPAWRTSTVLALANGIYEVRAFERLPILADALQDAGCDSDDILTHLRGDGPHSRGCWPLDLILGKE